jgi:hypothetical protein
MGDKQIPRIREFEWRPIWAAFFSGVVVGGLIVLLGYDIIRH